LESLKVIKNLPDIGIDLGVKNFVVTSKESFFSMSKEKYEERVQLLKSLLK